MCLYVCICIFSICFSSAPKSCKPSALLYFQLYSSSKEKISSTDTPNTFAISIASFRDGLYCPFSRRMIVSRLTPTFSARSPCFMSSLARYSLSFGFKLRHYSSSSSVLSLPSWWREKSAFKGHITEPKYKPYLIQSVAVYLYGYTSVPEH